MDKDSSFTTWQRAALLLAVLAVFVLSHAGSWSSSYIPHHSELLLDLARLADPEARVTGPDFAATGLHLGGPLYLALHLPAWLVPNPALGLYLCYAAYASLVLLALAAVAPRCGLPEGMAWLGVLLWAGWAPLRMQILEDSVLAAYLATGGTALLLWLLTRGRVRGLVGAGVLLSLAAHLHFASLPVLLGAAVAVTISPRHRWRGLLAITGGAIVVVLLLLPFAAHLPSGPEGSALAEQGASLKETFFQQLALVDPVAAAGPVVRMAPLWLPGLLVIGVAAFRPGPYRPLALGGLVAALGSLGVGLAGASVELLQSPLHLWRLTAMFEKAMLVTAPLPQLLQAAVLWLAYVALRRVLPAALRRWCSAGSLALLAAAACIAWPVHQLLQPEEPGVPRTALAGPIEWPTTGEAAGVAAPYLASEPALELISAQPTISFSPFLALLGSWRRPLAAPAPSQGDPVTAVLPASSGIHALALPGALEVGDTVLVPDCQLMEPAPRTVYQAQRLRLPQGRDGLVVLLQLSHRWDIHALDGASGAQIERVHRESRPADPGSQVSYTWVLYRVRGQAPDKALNLDHRDAQPPAAPPAPVMYPGGVTQMDWLGACFLPES